MQNRRYPGRQRVISRTDAINYVYDQDVKHRLADPATACLSPVSIAGIGLPSAILSPDKSKVPVEMTARCRKCEGCLNHRRRLWTARALEEVRVSERTWFGTLTARPEDRFRLALRADLFARKRGWEPLSEQAPEQAFRFVVAEYNREITTYLKRLRKETNATLRYLLVAEKHKTGDPHFHVLLHEAGTPVRKEVLERQWKLGFSSWRLCDEKSAFYVCKYLAKDMQTRVRASSHYGQPEKLLEALTERVDSATRQVQRSRSAAGTTPVSPGHRKKSQF